MGTTSKVARGSRAEVALRHRVNAARVVLDGQRSLFRSLFGNVSSDWKEDDTRVTFADYAISEKMIAALRADFPEDDFCTEETSPLDETRQLEAEYAWVLDPIDGTNNFYHGVPFCAISLGLLKNGFPVYGLIYDFSRDCMIAGGGGHELRVDQRRVVTDWQPIDERSSTAAFHFPMCASDLEKLQPWFETYRVRAFGSAALNLAYAALGKVDGCVDFKVRIWDIAAGIALMEAADGKVYFEGNSPFPMKSFNSNMPNLRYWAGSPEFVDSISQLLIPSL